MNAAAISSATLAPPVFLQLASHPLRWRMLCELARSDRMVNELTDLTEQPQNVVSYHLGKLRRADLVRSRRSSADGRDTYYTIDLGRVGASLDATGDALHAALRRDAPAGAPMSAGAPAARVLFLCTGNSARSQMAEALVRDRSGGAVDAASAGSRPKPLHPNAVRVMGEVYGIDLTRQRPKHLDEFAGEHFDRVVTMCDRVREECPHVADGTVAAHWSIADPSVAGDDDEATYPTFVEVAADVSRRVDALLADLTFRQYQNTQHQPTHRQSTHHQPEEP